MAAFKWVIQAVAPIAVMGALVSAAHAADPEFDAFRQSFRSEALAAGISAETYTREMATAEPLPIVFERDSNQPEFNRPVWSYLESAVSERRVNDGITNATLRNDTLAAVEEKYGVDRAIIAAIWGLESAYGKIMGDHDVVSSLATMAYKGRRTFFGKSQLIGALTILDKDYADRSQLKGSWAGAMGQTQFIPTTYLAYAVDEDGDGHRNLWTNHADIFASTANYLKRSGYKAGQPWGMEVMVPAEFDYGDASLDTEKTVAQWYSMGVRTPTGSLSDMADLNASASILVPAGANGPAFMVFDNYRAILKYNNSTSYALGVGMLSNAIAGRSITLAQDWPRDDRPLSLDERKQLQQTLADKGYDPGPVDGIIGAGTRKALKAWQRAQGVPADGYASAKTLAALTAS
ncbi:lytic murein transglycosylase [Parvularcula sp. LCG005]|uniref:lytic murein transglycosylase n=1 Tax=Parvularcula sp. LCG005 TaxID=3078805 RepID=UPI002943C0E5|nr:lytic murein transglycosylase [Parvularcula sp. LCG005]WOI53628.1 lytic murein transglycosylase [Parvularcula sp. LCG005]